MTYKKIYPLLAVGIFITILTGCRDPYKGDNQTYPLKIQTRIGSVATRAIEEGSFSAGSQLGLFFSENSSEGKEYKNYKYVAFGEGALQSWNPVNNIYLSPTPGQVIAYYPYSPVVADYYSVPVSAGEIDFMYSGKVDQVSSKHPDVSLQMKHALSCIRINVQRGTYTGTGKITSVSVQSGSFGTSGMLDAETGELTNVTGIGFPYTLSDQNKKITTENTASFELLVVPVEDRQALKIALTIDGKTYSCTTPAPAENLKQGSLYTCTCIVNQDRLTLSDIEIETPGEFDEDDNLIIEVNGYRVTIGGNTQGMAFSYHVSGGTLTLYAVSVDLNKIVKAASLSPSSGGTFSQTANDTSKTITLSNLKQDVTILFNGVEDKVKTVIYTLYTDQGTPDVYVNGSKVGTVSNGVLRWTAPEYDTHKTVTLQNVTLSGSATNYTVYQIQVSQTGQILNNGGTLWGTPGITTTYTLRERFAYRQKGPSANTSGVLGVGQTSIALYATSYDTAVGGEVGEYLNFNSVVSVSDTWKNNYSASGSNVTVTYPSRGGNLKLNFSTSSHAGYMVEFTPR